MRWIGWFNIAYGAIGMVAAFYIGRYEAIALCAWVIAVGIVMRSSLPKRLMELLKDRMKRVRS